MNKKTRLLTLFIGVLFLIFFYVFSHEVKRGFLKQTDFDVTVRLQNHIPKLFDEVWEDVAILVTPAPSVFIVGFLTIVAFANKKIRLRALIIPILFGTLVMGELYGKSVVHHPAPPFFMIKNPTTIFPQFYVNEQFSYPSGHTARAVFLAIVLWFLTIQQCNNITMKKRFLIGAGLGLYVGLVALGRIYLGHHWLSDVIGGGLLGIGIAFGCYFLTYPILY